MENGTMEKGRKIWQSVLIELYRKFVLKWNEKIIVTQVTLCKKTTEKQKDEVAPNSSITNLYYFGTDPKYN